MSEPFIGEIRMFAGNFAPRGWAVCNGDRMRPEQNPELFSLLGTTYGGDGRTQFNLPDLRGRIPIHAGSGPGLSARRLGATGGIEEETLTVAQLPSHGHGELQASTDRGNETSPAGNVLAASPQSQVYVEAAQTASLAGTAVEEAGGGDAHSNLQPFLCVNFIIALVGVYPSRA